MPNDNGERGAGLPYGSWKAVRTFIGKLKQTTIPPRIDSSVMVGMSGSGKSEMRTSLRYLGLIDSADSVTPKLKALVDAHGTQAWSDLLSDAVLAAYADVIGQEADWLDNGTAQLLREKFKAASGMDGRALDRATRFFLAALDDAGSSYSPHFKVRGARAASTKRTPTKKQSGKVPASHAELLTKPLPPNGTMQLPFSIPGKASVLVQIPEGLTEPEWTMIDAYVRGFVKLHGGKR